MAKKLNFLSVASIFLLTLTGSAAWAAEDADHNYGTLNSPAHIDEYSRIGSSFVVKKNISSTADIALCSEPGVECRTFTPGQASATIKCNGADDTAQDNGGWDANNISGQCWGKLTVCYGSGTPAEKCVDINGDPATKDNVSYTVESSCQDGAYGTPEKKQYCAHNYTGQAGVTGDTGDDMFKISQNAGAFFEYPRVGGLSDTDRLRWISRSGSETRGLMMPSGPAGSFEDYRSFIHNAPSSDVTVERACYKVSAHLCDGTGPTYPEIAGACGSAQGGAYKTMQEIAASGFCYIGTASNIQENDTEITWKCSGYGNNDNATSCRALKNDGGDLPPDVCSNFFVNQNVVFVQDLSASYHDDLPNLRTQMDALFEKSFFQNWRVGLTTFTITQKLGYTKVMDFKKVSEEKATLLNAINGYKQSTNSEDPYMALYRATVDFLAQKPEGESFTLVLITDEPDLGFLESLAEPVAPETLKAIGATGLLDGFMVSTYRDAAVYLILKNNLKLLVMGSETGYSNLVQNFYRKDLLSKVPGSGYVQLKSDSSDFSNALIKGLTEVSCP